jgi:hypothetical protein
MYIQLACLILFVSISSSQGSIPYATIQKDAAEITRLNQMFLANSPSAFHQMKSLVCEMINKCCPSIKSNFNEFSGKSTVGGPSVILNACIGSQSRQSFLRACPMVYRFLPVAHNPEILNYTVALLTAASQIEFSDVDLERPCSADEVYAAYCKPNPRKEMESCERKTITYVAEHNTDDQYTKYIQEVKSSLHFLINAMKSNSPKKNNKNQRNSYINNYKYSSN